MDRAHVLRALDYRQISTSADVTLMLLFTVLVLLVLYVGLLYQGKSKPAWLYITAVSIPMAILLYSCVAGFTQFMPEGITFKLGAMSLLRVFYLCDGVVILLAYSFKVSYEAMNLILFFVVQPLLIAGLLLRNIHLQSKLNSHDDDNSIKRSNVLH